MCIQRLRIIFPSIAHQFISFPSSSLTSLTYLLLHSFTQSFIFHHLPFSPLTTHHSTPILGNLDDTIDVDGLSLNDLRQSKSVKSISTAQYARMDALEHSRRALLKELQNAKISLETVFKTENFNDTTGVCVYICMCRCMCECVCGGGESVYVCA